MSDIFDFFKNNESKLHEQPPEKVWQQLEVKLDKNRRPKRRTKPFLQLGAISLMILILILAAVLVWHFSKK